MKIFLKMLQVVENKFRPEIKLYLAKINLLNKYTKINLPGISFFRLDQYKQFESSLKGVKAGPILESKVMGEIFQKKCKELLKKGKIIESLGKNILNLEIF